jgi:DNA polymerase-3 subunit delta
MTIDDSFKKSEFKNLYLLCGSESYIINNYLNKFKKLAQYPDFDLFEYTDIVDFNNLSNILMSNPMLSEKKIVIIDCKDFSNKVNNSYYDLFDKISKNTILIIVEREIEKKSSLYKYIEKNGIVTECKPVELYQLKTLAERYFRSQKVNISQNDIQYFIDRVGKTPDINIMINEANKLVNFAKEEVAITREMIDKVCIISLEDKVFDMINYQVKKDNFRFEKLYADLLDLKEEPAKIFALIKDQYLKIISVKSMENFVKSDEEIMKALNINFDWKLRNFKTFAKRFDISRLEVIIDRIAALELKMKTSTLSDRTALEILLFNV